MVNTRGQIARALEAGAMQVGGAGPANPGAHPPPPAAPHDPQFEEDSEEEHGQEEHGPGGQQAGVPPNPQGQGNPAAGQVPNGGGGEEQGPGGQAPRNGRRRAEVEPSEWYFQRDNPIRRDVLYWEGLPTSQALPKETLQQYGLDNGWSDDLKYLVPPMLLVASYVYDMRAQMAEGTFTRGQVYQFLTCILDIMNSTFDPLQETEITGQINFGRRRMKQKAKEDSLHPAARERQAELIAKVKELELAAMFESLKKENKAKYEQRSWRAREGPGGRGGGDGGKGGSGASSSKAGAPPPSK